MPIRDHYDLQKVGRILKSYGNDGELIIELDRAESTEPIFIYFDGLPVPFFFDSFQLKNSSKAVARITGVSSIKDTEELLGKDIYAYHCIGADFTEIPVGEILSGWEIHNKGKSNSDNVFGTVTDFLDIPGNPCIEVTRTNGETALIPFHDDLVIGIDKKQKILTMAIPKGL